MRDVLISTTQRCGSTWAASIAQLLMRQELALYVPAIDLGLLNYTLFGESDEDRVERFSQRINSLKPISRAFKTHDLPVYYVSRFLSLNPNFVVINVNRDFRDVLISRIHYNLFHLPSVGRELESQMLAELKDQGDREIVQRFIYTSEFLEWLVDWKMFNQPIDHPRYLALKYEDMIKPGGLPTAVEQVRQLLCEYDNEISSSITAEVCNVARFETMEQNEENRPAGVECKKSFCRKGISGDFRNYLTERQARWIEILMK